MACGHAKFTGEVGVCMATSGPGAIHLLNGLYDAKMDHQPVVAIVGQPARTAIGGSYQQEVDLHKLFKDVAGEYVHMARRPEQMRHLVDRAVRIAKSERTVTCIICPNDLQELTKSRNPPASTAPCIPVSIISTRSLFLSRRTCSARQISSMAEKKSPSCRRRRTDAADEVDADSQTAAAQELPRRFWAKPPCPTTCLRNRGYRTARQSQAGT